MWAVPLRQSVYDCYYDMQRKVWFIYKLCMNCASLDRESLDPVSWTSTAIEFC